MYYSIVKIYLSNVLIKIILSNIFLRRFIKLFVLLVVNNYECNMYTAVVRRERW